MTSTTDIVNRALQAFGSRTTVTAAELANNTTNEAIQANLVLTQLRNQVLRMAPWNAAFNYNNLNLITAAPGTPENTTSGTTLWAKGQPPPPWAYEYQYPVDCLRDCWVVPQFQTGFAGGVPITTAVTGGAASFWQGPPVKHKVGIDQFYPVTAAVVAAGGTGYAVGDVITLASGASTSAPIGFPVQLVVLTAPGGVVGTVSVVNQVNGSANAIGGSYFAVQSNPVAQGSVVGVGGSTSAGTGATFTLTQSTVQGDQRVILTNQEFATLAYVKQVVDPNVMDDLLQEAWVQVVGAWICLGLSGDKNLANMCLQKSNNCIVEARKVDGNEGLTINDVTPDFIRIRGISYSDYSYSPNISFDWGGLWTPF